MEQLVINLHYSTGNVNHILYASQDLPSSLVISKDAESIILQCSALGILGESVTSFLTITWDQSRTRFHKTSTIVKTAFWISLDTQTGANKLHATYSNQWHSQVTDDARALHARLFFGRGRGAYMRAVQVFTS